MAVFAALRTFDRPATRVEIESESGMDRDEVRKGLQGLERRGDLVVDGEPRKLTTYALRSGAQKPTDLRGKHWASRPPTSLAVAQKVRVKPKVIIGKLRRRAHGIPDESAAELLRRIWRKA